MHPTSPKLPGPDDLPDGLPAEQVPLQRVFNEIKRLRLQSLLALSGCLLLLGGWAVGRLFDAALRPLYEVRSFWDGDTLRVSAIRGYVVITHLVGTSEGTSVGARLPTPAFILDSESVRIPYATLAAMDWRDEGHGRHPAPPAGSPVRALYVRPEAGEYRPLP
jgi:hypothetical protein